MELIYIYFDDFNNFQKEELHLNKNFKVDFDKNTKRINSILKLDNKESIYPNNVRSLNVLVGKNSTGKSNVLKLIKDDYYFRHIKYFKIYYVKTVGTHDIYQIFSSNKEIELKINSKTIHEEKIELKISKEKDRKIDVTNLRTISDKITNVFIAGYTLETGFTDSIYKDSYDTNKTDFFSYSEQIESFFKIWDTPDLFNDEKYAFYMLYIDIAHLHSIEEFIESRKHHFRESSPYDESFKFETSIIALNKIRKNMRDELDPSYEGSVKKENIDKLDALILYVEHFLAYYLVTLENKKDFNDFNILIKDINKNVKVTDGKGILYYTNSVIKLIDYIHNKEILSNLSLSKDELEKLKKYLGKEITVTNTGMVININKNLKQDCEFLKAVEILETKFVRTIYTALCYLGYDNPINHIKKIKDKTQAGINYLSSAENIYLNIHMAIFKAIEESNNKNITLIFDEPEIHMHPDLATKFINTLFEIIQNERFLEYSFDIIIATHSPFILSDILSGDIKYLIRNDKNNYVTISTRNNNTFAGNIQNIISDSYFLTSTIGEFSRNKINSAIKFLKSNEVDEEQLRNIEYLINNISEPLAKEYLMRLYRSKTNLGFLSSSDIESRKALYENLKKEFGEEDR